MTPADAAALVRADRDADGDRRPVVVIDANVLVVALADDGPDGDRVRQRLRGEHLSAPS